MPEPSPESALLRSAKACVIECGGNLTLASETLNVDYYFLRRYIKKGSGSSQNLQELQAGLAAWQARPHIQAANICNVVQPGETLPLTRAVLTDLLAAVDVLQARAPKSQGAGQ